MEMRQHTFLFLSMIILSANVKSEMEISQLHQYKQNSGIDKDTGCPMSCECVYSEDGLTVRCTEGLMTTEELQLLLEAIPEEVSVLDFSPPKELSNNFSISAKDFERFSSLRELRMQYCGLTSLGDKRTFERLRSLKILDVSDNEIQRLSSDTFENAEQIEQLLLSRNQLHLNHEIYPPAVKLNYLSGLKVLVLDGNGLSQLPVGMFHGLSALQTLILSNNKLEQLDPKAFTELQNLTSLNLNNCWLRSVAVELLQALSSLRQLQLSNNKLTSVPIGALRAVAETLHVLDLSGNRISVLQNFTFNGTKLTQLILSGNGLGSNVGIGSISGMQLEAFEGANHVAELDLSDNGLQSFDGQLLSPLASTLRVLKLSSNPLHPAVSSIPADLQLEELHLSNTGLTKLPLFSPETLKQLTLLNISHNQLNYLSLSTILSLTSLKVLDISNNNFTLLPPYLLHYITGLKQVYLHGNPWDCTCRGTAFRDMLSRLKNSISCNHRSSEFELIQCGSPSKFRGRPVVEISHEEAWETCYRSFLGGIGLKEETEIAVLLVGCSLLVLVLGVITAVLCNHSFCNSNSNLEPHSHSHFPVHPQPQWWTHGICSKNLARRNISFNNSLQIYGLLQTPRNPGDDEDRLNFLEQRGSDLSNHVLQA